MGCCFSDPVPLGPARPMQPGMPPPGYGYPPGHPQGYGYPPRPGVNNYNGPAGPVYGYGPQGYGPQGYGPQGYPPQGQYQYGPSTGYPPQYLPQNYGGPMLADPYYGRRPGGGMGGGMGTMGALGAGLLMGGLAGAAMDGDMGFGGIGNGLEGAVETVGGGIGDVVEDIGDGIGDMVNDVEDIF